MITLTNEQFETIIKMIAVENRLQAIKIVHDVLEFSLADARVYVDNLIDFKYG